jgi:hypothetical protein
VTQRSSAFSDRLDVIIIINIILSTNTISMKYESSIPYSAVSDIYNVQWILIILDRNIKSTIA